MSSKGKGKNSSSSNGKKEMVPPYVLILCGLPGSGKSTISNELEQFGWIRVNQDDLGTVDECKKIMEKALKHGKSVIVDRCNVHMKERKMWVTEGKKWTEKIEVFFLNTPVEVCKQRAKERTNHPNLDIDKADEVIEQFAKGLHAPQKFEGPYTNVMIANTPQEISEVVKTLSQYDISKKKL